MSTPTPIQNEIARQLHVQKPAHLVPGRDIQMLPTVENGMEGIAINVATDGTLAIVLYNAGADTYVVVRKRYGQDTELLDDVYCDQLGDLIFGSDASAFDEPMVRIYVRDEATGEWRKDAEI